MVPVKDVMSLLMGVGILYPELFLLLTRHSRVKHETADFTLITNWLLILGGCTVAVAIGVFDTPSRMEFNLSELDYFLIFSNYLLGILLRIWAIRHLGESFTVDVSIRSGQWLNETGPYSLIRHPSYTGLFMALSMFAMSLSNWLAVLVIIPCTFLALWIRIHVEERALVGTFGATYRVYQSNTWRLIPFVW